MAYPYQPPEVRQAMLCSNCGNEITTCSCCDTRPEQQKINIFREDIINLKTKLLDAIVSKDNEKPEQRKRIKALQNILGQKVKMYDLLARSELVIAEMGNWGNKL